MKRRLFAAAWIMGATLPLLMATVFVVGCCVLPFHGIVHKLMPLCQMAADVMRGERTGADHEHEATPPPAREKKEPVRKIATRVPAVFRVAAATGAPRVLTPSAIAGYRSFLTLGAMRCDQDVGLHVLGETFLI